MLLTWAAHAQREVKDPLWINRWFCMCVCINQGVHCFVCIWSVCMWAEPHLSLCASGSCCLPSWPVRVCLVGSSQPARWVASRAGSPGPQGVLFPAPASHSLLDLPPATCIETQWLLYFVMDFHHKCMLICNFFSHKHHLMLLCTCSTFLTSSTVEGSSPFSSL